MPTKEWVAIVPKKFESPIPWKLRRIMYERLAAVRPDLADECEWKAWAVFQEPRRYTQALTRLLDSGVFAETLSVEQALLRHVPDGPLFARIQEHRTQLRNQRELLHDETRLLASRRVVVEGERQMRCSRCKSEEIEFWEEQTRSADEPMTVFYRCTKCSKQWRR